MIFATVTPMQKFMVSATKLKALSQSLLSSIELNDAQLPGSILLVLDSISSNDLNKLREYNGYPLHIYAVGSPNAKDISMDGAMAEPINIELLEEAKSNAGGT